MPVAVVLAAASVLGIAAATAGPALRRRTR